MQESVQYSLCTKLHQWPECSLPQLGAPALCGPLAATAAAGASAALTPAPPQALQPAPLPRTCRRCTQTRSRPAAPAAPQAALPHLHPGGDGPASSGGSSGGTPAAERMDPCTAAPQEWVASAAWGVHVAPPTPVQQQMACLHGRQPGGNCKQRQAAGASGSGRTNVRQRDFLPGPNVL